MYSNQSLPLKTISTVTVNVPILEEEQLPKLDAWLRSILWDSKLPGLGSESHVQMNPKKRMWEEEKQTQKEERRKQDVAEDSLEIHRLKARLPLSNGDVKIVQGVRDIFEIFDGPKSSDSAEADVEQRTGKIVLIGRYLTDLPFDESFRNAIRS